MRVPDAHRRHAQLSPLTPCLHRFLLLRHPRILLSCHFLHSLLACPPPRSQRTACLPSPTLFCSKAPIQAFADRVSAVFVPVVAVLAVLTWAAWYCAGIAGWYPASWLPQASSRPAACLLRPPAAG